MMRGVVMKITEDRIVVLADDGKFRNLAHMSVMPSLGDKIIVPDVPVVLKPQANRRAQSKLWIGSIAASLLLLVGIVWMIGSFNRMPEPVAMVAIDINPSVELWVDHNEKVNKVVMVNDDAKLLIEEKELLGSSFYNAVQIIVTKAEEQGYLQAETEKKYVFMSVINLDEEIFDVNLEKLAPAIKAYNLEVNHLEPLKHEQAKELGLSLNKYMVYEEAQQKGITLDVEELRTHSIAVTLSQSSLDPSSFLSNDDKNPSGTVEMADIETDIEVVEKQMEEIEKQISNTGNSKDEDEKVVKKESTKKDTTKEPSKNENSAKNENAKNDKVKNENTKNENTKNDKPKEESSLEDIKKEKSENGKGQNKEEIIDENQEVEVTDELDQGIEPVDEEKVKKEAKEEVKNEKSQSSKTQGENGNNNSNDNSPQKKP